MPKLLPTIAKFKISSLLSYPIGAEAISVCLADVPQYEKLGLWFTNSNFRSLGAFQRARAQNRPYTIVQASMFKIRPTIFSSKHFIDEGFYNERWEVHILAVPRELRSVINGLIITKALPHIKSWLEQPRTDIWMTERKHCMVQFHEEDARLSIAED